MGATPNNPIEDRSADTSAARQARWFVPVVGLAVVLSIPCYFSLNTFFSHDDFVIL